MLYRKLFVLIVFVVACVQDSTSQGTELESSPGQPVIEPRGFIKRRRCRKYGICDGAGYGGQQGGYGGYQQHGGYPPINIGVAQSQAGAAGGGYGFGQNHYPGNYQYNGYPSHGGYQGPHQHGYEGYNQGYGGYNNFNGNYHGGYPGYNNGPYGGNGGFGGPQRPGFGGPGFGGAGFGPYYDNDGIDHDNDDGDNRPIGPNLFNDNQIGRSLDKKNN